MDFASRRPPPDSMSRSHTSQTDVESLADQMLNARLSALEASHCDRTGFGGRDGDEDGRGASRSYTTAYGHASPSESGTAVHSASSSKNSSAFSRTNSTRASTSMSASTASSRTRNQLRKAELERDEFRQAMLKEKANASDMRRLAEKNKAVAERLKREGNATATGLCATDAKFRMLELERETRAAKAERKAPMKGMFRAACSTDLLFLIDTTSSMTGHIDAAKKQVLDIVQDIKEGLLDDVDVRIAVVGYKDHYDRDSIESIDFTTSAPQVKSFIGGLFASGGGDIPEDVLGGIQEALEKTWKQQTRCIIHIADAPAHGSVLNTCLDDNYPSHGKEPHALKYKPLLDKMIGMNINYTFLRITKLTDLMTSAFLKQYFAAGADGSLHSSNIYYKHTRNPLDSASFDTSMTARGTLRFAEMDLGTSYSDIRRLVVSSVTSSASRTAVRMSSLRSSNAWSSKSPKSKLDILSEEDVYEEVFLGPILPNWDLPNWLSEKLTVEGFTPNVFVHGAGTLDHKMASDEHITMEVSELTILKRPQPFAQGAMRVAFFAGTASSRNRYVVKSFKRGGKRLAHLVEDMRCQALCKAFALEFNALSNEAQSIDFIATTCFKGRGDGSSDNCLSLEPYIPGTYIKYNTNSGWINEKRYDDRFFQIAQTFSHFTFERSKGRFLVCDLQGVGCILTDPAIHTRDPERFKLMDTNLGVDGFKFFFSTHTCNDICATLSLQSKASMLRPDGILSFRTVWPLLDRTTCCSNKLCGKIIHMWTARRSDEYPEYYWCTDCYPQLREYTQRWLCVAGGADHEFDVSTFFYESQGRRAPRKCPSHREDSELALDRSKVYGDMALTTVNVYPFSPSDVTATSEPFAGSEAGTAVVIEPFLVHSGLASDSPSYDSELATPTSPTPLSPVAFGDVATPRNSNRLWAKLKSATKYRKSSSRLSLGT